MSEGDSFATWARSSTVISFSFPSGVSLRAASGFDARRCSAMPCRRM
jgi:hypothetical protein